MAIKKNKIPFIVLVIVLFVLPITLILIKQTQDNRSSAAAADKLEAESGTLGGNAAIKTDSSASGGQYVALGINVNQTPTPASTTYDAVFTGDATGATDVTTLLTSFLQASSGKKVALAVNGTYLVTRVEIDAVDNWSVDFRGSRLITSTLSNRPVLKFTGLQNAVINDAWIEGQPSYYSWDISLEGQHGMEFVGGKNITINRPKIRNVHGDGIYTSWTSGYGTRYYPATNLVINQPDIERAARNGIAPVAGEVAVYGGHIAYVGIHGVDYEVNDPTGAASIKGIVSGVYMHHLGNLNTGYGAYAVAAGGYTNSPKPSMLVENNRGDRLDMTIRYTQDVRVRNNTSETQAQADFPGSTVIEFINNIRISKI